MQLSSIGCPVVNDVKYGNKKSKGNLALWATVLKFNHPVNKSRLTFKVIPPADEKPWNNSNIEKYA